MAKAKNTGHIIVLVLLGIIFLGLLFFSTEKSQIQVNSIFKEEFTLTSIPGYYSKSPTIGTIEITNNGVLPKKVFLDKYALCYFSENGNEETIEVLYKGDISFMNSEVFSGRSEIQFVEPSAKETINIDVVAYFLTEYTFKETLKKSNNTIKNGTFYLYKLPQNEIVHYNYCSSQKKEDSIRTINVNFDIDQKELENDEYY